MRQQKEGVIAPVRRKRLTRTVDFVAVVAAIVGTVTSPHGRDASARAAHEVLRFTTLL